MRWLVLLTLIVTVCKANECDLPPNATTDLRHDLAYKSGLEDRGSYKARFDVLNLNGKVFFRPHSVIAN